MSRTYDLTGVNALFKYEDYTVKQFVLNQIVQLPVPMYSTSIEVKKVSTVTEIVNEGVYWEIYEEDHDAMSKAKLAQSDFSGILVKSIRLIYYTGVEANILISGQGFYKNDMVLPSDGSIELTPDLMISLIDEVGDLKLMINPSSDTSSITSAAVSLLAQDIDMTNAANAISSEIHTVDVPGGRHTIHPVNGSFFGGSETLVNVETGATLVKDVDYKLYSCNLEKTKATPITDGVFDAILILSSIVGDVEVDYHAFGGGVTQSDITAVLQQYADMIAYFQEQTFITVDNLNTTTVFIAMQEKIQNLEETMRRMILTGRPTYADKTNRTSILRVINSPDSDLHWYNVATLYKVDGSDDIFTNDRAFIRFELSNTGLMFEAAINFNKDTNPTISIDRVSDNLPEHYTRFDDFTDIDKQIIPQFRIIYNDNTTYLSGAILQVGFAISAFSSETMVIEDLSGDESAWILVPEVEETVNPEDDTLDLPSGEHIWDTSNVESIEHRLSYPIGTQGYLAWAGALALTGLNGGPTEKIHYLKTSELSNIAEVVIELKDSSENIYTYSAKVGVDSRANVIIPSDVGYGDIIFVFTQDAATKIITMETIGDIPGGMDRVLHQVYVNFT